MDRRSLILLGALALAGCASTQTRKAAAPFSAFDIIFQALEPVSAAHSGPDGLTIRLASQGCATKADIVFHVERKSGAAYVAFARRKIGGCPQAAAAALVFSRQELGVPPRTPLFLLNPISGS